MYTKFGFLILISRHYFPFFWHIYIVQWDDFKVTSRYIQVLTLPYHQGSYRIPILDVNVSIESYGHNKEKTFWNLGSISYPAPTRKSKVTSMREKSVILKASQFKVNICFFLLVAMLVILSFLKYFLTCKYKRIIGDFLCDVFW